MKIGLLAYHSVCNFGAFLQLLSTVGYLRKNGYEPRVINWVPEDLEKDYDRRCSKEVRDLYATLRNQYFPLTSLCRTSEDISNVIEDEDINAVIIGSDAVCQHHPFRERFHFPTKKIFYIAHPTCDRMFPNPFWGTFTQYLKQPIPIAMISGSSQNSNYKYIHGKTKRQMAEALKKFQFISVRDDWTQKMFSYLTNGAVVPTITPDPVFAFNHNAKELIPLKDEILSKFSIPNCYFLLSFKGKGSVDQKWITLFETESQKHGIACVKLPYADFPAYGDCKYTINNPLSPLDWYGLIKYSKGYVGNNMHPIVVSIHNSTPFFSFDNYGLKNNEISSKIYHILKTAGLLKYRTFINAPNYNPPRPQDVISSLIEFDHSITQSFSANYYQMYQKMMESVIKSIK